MRVKIGTKAKEQRAKNKEQRAKSKEIRKLFLEYNRNAFMN